MHHRFIALPFAVIASLILASIALAGGWAEVTVKDAPVDPPAGGQTLINLDVLQHGVTPVSWPNLTVIATDAATGAVVRTKAQAKGPEGSYVATVVFPSAGAWTLTFTSPELDMAESVAKLNVAPAAIAAAPAVVAAAQSVAVAPAAASFDVMTVVLVLLAALGAFAVLAGLLLRREGASTGSRVTVRT
ncbi:MAG: hypothetical protein ABIP53_06680 [Candidatus Limnocylindrales bacterium]